MCYGFKGEVQSPGIYAQALHYVLWDGGLRFRRPTVKHPSQGPWGLALSWNTAGRGSEGKRKSGPSINLPQQEVLTQEDRERQRPRENRWPISLTRNFISPKTHWGQNGPNIHVVKFAHPSCFSFGSILILGAPKKSPDSDRSSIQLPRIIHSSLTDSQTNTSTSNAICFSACLQQNNVNSHWTNYSRP